MVVYDTFEANIFLDRWFVLRTKPKMKKILAMLITVLYHEALATDKEIEDIFPKKEFY